ncbi:unnamed protein product [Linum tenue]|uniref:Uncharacterized protein n=1 Tax=Linum tenue TaxID=586396 RepID=A0AAV0RHV1_9ROSI|nr:unnamed protein product [Linum tenue]
MVDVQELPSTGNVDVQEVNQPAADEDLMELEACIRRGDIAKLRDLIRQNPDSASRRFSGGGPDSIWRPSSDTRRSAMS